MSEHAKAAPLNAVAAMALTVAVALAVKLSVWAYYGPVPVNDTALYAAFAQMLMQDDWSWQYTFFDDPTPVTGLRMIGYPAVLALAQIVAADAWRDAVVGLQIGVSLASVAMVTLWVYRLTGSTTRAIIGGLSIAVGQSAIYDPLLLPDSLFSSIAIMILCTLSGRPAPGQSGPALSTALLCGAGVAATSLLRANGVHIAILFLPLAVVWLSQARTNRFSLALALILPMVITVQTYMQWNQYRTGVRFLSTSAQIVAFQPLYEMAQHGTNVFTDDSVLSRTVRETTTTYDYADIDLMNRRLKAEHGWTSVEIAEAGTKVFVDAAFSEPLALMRNAGRAFGFTVIRSLFNPALAVSEGHHMITAQRLFPGASKIFKSISTQSAGTVLYAVIYSVGAIVSTILFASFLIAAPIRCAKGGNRRDHLSVFTLWMGTMALFAYYSLIHLEIRYILPAVPIVIGVGLWALPRIRARRLTF